MVTLKLSDREATLLAGVLDDAIINASVEVDILSMHYPSEAAEIAGLEYDLDTIYDLSDAVDNALWAAEVGV